MFTKSVATIYELTIHQNHAYLGLFPASGRTEVIHLYFQTKEQADYYASKYYSNRNVDLKSHLAYENDGRWVLLHERNQAYPVMQPEKLYKQNYLTFPAGWQINSDRSGYADTVEYQEFMFSSLSYTQLINCGENKVIGLSANPGYYMTADVPYQPRSESLQAYFVNANIANSLSESNVFIYKDNAGQYSTIKSSGKSVSLIPAVECTPEHNSMLPQVASSTKNIAATVAYQYTPSVTDKVEALELYSYVKKADYRNIEAMWKKNPHSMFVDIYLKNGDTTTPLKTALYNLDKWTWKPFYEWVKQNRPELENEFLKQNAEQKQHIDAVTFQPLFAEYESYISKRNDIYHARDSAALSQGKTAVDHQWPRLAQMQRKILPWHFIREMCREGKLSVGHSLGPDARFDHNTPPLDGRISNDLDSGGVKLDSDDFLRKFGTGGHHNYFLGLVRGKSLFANGGNPWSTGEYNQAGGNLKGDVEVLQQLLKIRTADLAYIPAPVVAVQADNVAVPAEKEEYSPSMRM